MMPTSPAPESVACADEIPGVLLVASSVADENPDAEGANTTSIVIDDPPLKIMGSVVKNGLMLNTPPETA